MSLIKFYSPQSNKTLNHETICQGCHKCSISKYKNIPYPTTPLTEFDNISIKQLHLLIEDQQKASKEMAQLHLKYQYLTPKAYDQTIEQYTNLIFLNNHAYQKDSVIDYILKQQNEINTHLNSTIDEIIPQSTLLQKQSIQNTVYVSKEAIRNITGYSYNALAYHINPQTNIRSRTKVMGTIKWQKEFIDDMADVIVVDGCRQQGKSMTVAEKAMELSFIPNHDILVAAFSVNATNLIRNYIRKFVKKFPTDAFDENRKEGYITNLRTLTKIHFKTLADEGTNVLGLTIKTAIVDEAHLVDVATFENALEPTLSANDGQLILLGTAAKNKNCYMYQCIMEIKTSKYSQQNSSYYKVSIDDNPITSPKLRDKVEANKDRPSYKRQYYNFWGDIGDNLFSLPREVNLPDPMKRTNNDFLVLGIDPARKNDRSGYSLIYVSKGKATIILSGEVPESHKSEWNLQAAFYKQLIQRFQIILTQQSQNLYIVMDVTGVGDGVSTIFMNEGIQLSARIRYTSGNTESSDGFDFNVSKTILINNIIDLSQENVLTVYELTNKLLLEEMEHIEEGADKRGNITMTSDFFDDITNATMVGGYYITHRNFVSRSITAEKAKYIPTGNPQIDAIESLEYNNSKGYISQYQPQAVW